VEIYSFEVLLWVIMRKYKIAIIPGDQGIRKAIEKYRAQKVPYRQRKLPPKKVLEELYLKCGMSLHHIAGLFGVSYKTVYRWSQKYNIELRSPYEYTEARSRALSEATMKYPKRPFKGSLEEKAYLLGFACGDLYVRRHYRQIRVETCSTHLAFLELFYELFRHYGHVHRYPVIDKLTWYSWHIRCDLDESFNFLLKREAIPEWILDSEKYFHYYLAGLFDAEGSISIKCNQGRIKRCLTVASFNGRTGFNDSKQNA
jgi:transposase